MVSSGVGRGDHCGAATADVPWLVPTDSRPKRLATHLPGCYKENVNFCTYYGNIYLLDTARERLHLELHNCI